MKNPTTNRPFSQAYIDQRNRVYDKDKAFLALIKQGEIIVDAPNGKVYRKDGKTQFRDEFNPSGYVKVYFTETQYIMKHRLIMLAANGMAKDQFLEVGHIDNDKENNKLANLVYCTRSENVKAAFDTKVKVSKGYAPSLSTAEILQCQKLRKDGWSYGQIARQFGIHHMTIKKYADGAMIKQPGGSGAYKVRSPRGEVFEGTNLKEFCALKNLSYTGMKYARKNGTVHKGWSHLPIK